MRLSLYRLIAAILFVLVAGAVAPSTAAAGHEHLVTAQPHPALVTSPHALGRDQQQCPMGLCLMTSRTDCCGAGGAVCAATGVIEGDSRLPLVGHIRSLTRCGRRTLLPSGRLSAVPDRPPALIAD